jgi:hypothetical protein
MGDQAKEKSRKVRDEALWEAQADFCLYGELCKLMFTVLISKVRCACVFVYMPLFWMDGMCNCAVEYYVKVA